MDSLIDQALKEWQPAAVYALFSGGHDSLTSTAIAAKHPAFSAVVHINTGIGIEETREFVKGTCEEQGWPLIELYSESRYEDLVLERGGFPSGPKSHSSMYWYLKQKPLDALLRDTKRYRGDHVVLVTGIRLQESVRRMAAGISVPIRRDDHCRVWVNPILDWSAVDCGRFMETEGLKRNPVVDLLHRSGECLCGALAREEEIHEIDAWFPEAGKRIHDLERPTWTEKSPLAPVALAACSLKVRRLFGTSPLSRDDVVYLSSSSLTPIHLNLTLVLITDQDIPSQYPPPSMSQVHDLLSSV